MNSKKFIFVSCVCYQATLVIVVVHRYDTWIRLLIASQFGNVWYFKS